MNVTIYGERVFAEMAKLNFMLFCVTSDDRSHNQRLSEAHERRKAENLERLAKLVAPTLPPESKVEDCIKYTGEDPSIENADYSAFLDRSLGEMVLCRAVDHYHWYLRRVVLLILNQDATLIRPWAKKLRIREDEQLEAFERGENRTQILNEWFRGREWRTRQLVHEHWDMQLKEDLDVLVKVRNCIVHALGEDTGGELSPVLSQNARLGLPVEGGRVVVGSEGADVAIGVVLADISIIDPCLARAFSLPTAPYVPRRTHRNYS